MRIWPGRPFPLGATWDGHGVNVALFSESGERAELCLFDSLDADRESTRIELPERTDGVFHGYLPDLRPGAAYGFRVHGPFDPVRGLRFNPAKLLLDPYARAIGRGVRWHDALLGSPAHSGPDRDLVRDGRDSAPYAPRGLVVDAPFEWGADRRPETPWHRTVIYEAHVKGLTKRHPAVPPALRGTYAALATEPIVGHLRSLGVTAVELLPVHYHVDEPALARRGQVNYWGYNTLGYFAPDPRYAATRDPVGVINEFRAMVKALHAAGIEVLLDVVYNHTAEGSETGPTLSFRGIDNRAYYHLAEGGRRCLDFAGTGNSLNVGHPWVLQLVLDSLRYWVAEMHVDGFRFDLASVLARAGREVEWQSTFFDTVHQDPVVSRVKLIAEPWDVGPGGYRVGRFPAPWSEWNGLYRDVVRRFWRGNPGMADDFATRISGSSDLYGSGSRGPTASVNFVTAHDGFSLADLVSYERKHNEANLEGNRDGIEWNDSWNCGAEGPTDDPAILARRARERRNLVTTLLLSQGVPMLVAGDELGHSQQGNNNAYCQDNEMTWLDWSPGPEDAAFVELVRFVVRLRAREPVFHRRHFFRGRSSTAAGPKDIYWLTPAGREMTDEEWATADLRTVGVGLVGNQIPEPDERGRPITGGSFLLLFNAADTPVEYRLDAFPRQHGWIRVLDTARDGPPGRGVRLRASRYRVEAHALAVLRMAPFSRS